MAAVISGGYGETPCAATPWSPAKITSRTFVEPGGRHRALAGRQPDGQVAEPARAPRRAWPGRRAAPRRARRDLGVTAASQAGRQLAARAATAARLRLQPADEPVRSTPMTAHIVAR